jgi:hypothetical protein
VEDLLFAASKKLPGFARLGRWDTCPYVAGRDYSKEKDTAGAVPLFSC